jgi:hypothetical protein
MNVPVRAEVDDATSAALAELALGEPEFLRAIAPQISGPKAVAAAPELMAAPRLDPAGRPVGPGPAPARG